MQGEVNYEIDPHIIMMTRKNPETGEILNLDDEI